MQIVSREELINALMDGAELEHNLACMYLFAAFTIKSNPAELIGVPEAQRAQVITQLNSWSSRLRKIAKQEMGHLGTVCNLLTLLGAEAHFDRPNFPPADGYYPPTAKITLQRFCLPALQRFVEFERNDDSPAVLESLAPQTVPYQHVGELYAAILQAFNEPADGGLNIANAQLFLGFDKAMDKEWGGSNTEVHDFGLGGAPPVTIDELRAKIREALADVIEEGEGAQNPTVNSHYELFYKMAEDLKVLHTQYPDLDPARPVQDNPVTQMQRGSGSNISLITATTTRDVAELFNSFYGTMLMALRQMFSFNENLGDEDRRSSMHSIALTIMQSCISRLGSALTTMPIANDPTKLAGPGFEIYRPLYVTDKPQVAWKVIAERLDLAHQECARLLALGTLPTQAVSAVTGAQGVAEQLKNDAMQLASLAGP